MGTASVRSKGSRSAHGEKLNCNAVAAKARAISTESSEIALQSSSFLKARVHVGCSCGDVIGVS